MYTLTNFFINPLARAEPRHPEIVVVPTGRREQNQGAAEIIGIARTSTLLHDKVETNEALSAERACQSQPQQEAKIDNAVGSCRAEGRLTAD